MDASPLSRYVLKLIQALRLGGARRHPISRALLLGVASLSLPGLALAAVPGQFIAKMYTEV
jgi:hypothetical protein